VSTSKVQETVTAIMDAIVCNKYVGFIPTQDVLAQKLGVSRPVIREAISQLEAHNIVVCMHKHGTKIQPAAEWHFVNPDVLRWGAEAGVSAEEISAAIAAAQRP
jgi:DNA-binding FadR family transcriptional regulator